MHNISNLSYFGTTLYMFRTVFSPIIRGLRLYIQHHIYAIQVLWLLASKQVAVSVWHIPDAVCTVLDSWWWTERPSETCRVLFQNKINLRYCASSWFYYRNILWCTVLQTSHLVACNTVLQLHTNNVFARSISYKRDKWRQTVANQHKLTRAFIVQCFIATCSVHAHVTFFLKRVNYCKERSFSWEE
jgi:hypothetical protein